MKKIYISLPIAGCEYTVDIRNEEACNWVISHLEGYDCVSPLDINELNPDNLTEERDWQKFMGRDIEALLRCDAILMCEGWQNGSKGCMAEFEVAKIYGKEIYIMR